MFVRNGVWHICIRHNGKKIQRSLNIPAGKKEHKKIAKDMESKIRVQLIEDTFFDKPIACTKTLRQMMDKFIKEHAPKNSKSMQRSYSSYLKHLIRIFGNIKLTLISPKKVTRYKVLRRQEGAKPATINREMAMLLKAFNLSIREWEWIKDNPVSKVPFEKENNKRDRWLSGDEEKRLLEFCPDWLREIVIFALNTGLRQDELLSLEWSRVSIARKTILIQKTKSGRPRTIPLNRFAFGVLNDKFEEKVRNIKDLVFVSSVGTKINPSNLRREFYKVLKMAEIENFKFHDLRHTFASRLAQKGIDIYKIAKLLGHEDIRMTQRYAHHCPESLRVGVEILESDCVLTSVDQKEVLTHA